MADQFPNAIATIMTSLGYPCVIQSSPSKRERLTAPIVLITPSNKSRVNWHAFGHKNIVSSYDLFYCYTTGLINAANLPNDQFVKDCVTYLMGNTFNVYGSWQSRVKPNKDYDRGVFPAGWYVTSVTVDIFWIG